MRYYIPTENLKQLQKKANTIAKKCEKYNVPFNFEIIGECIHEIDGLDVKCYEIECEGNAINEGFEIVATIDHTENGNIINKIMDVEIPSKYRHTEPICEHCNTKRARKNTCLVYNKTTKEYKQVGNSCVKEYTEGLDIQIATYYATFFKEIGQCEHLIDNRHYEIMVNPIDVLTLALEIVSKLGYARASESPSTKSIYFDIKRNGKASEHWIEKMEKIGSYNPNRKENRETAKTIIEYFKTVSTNNDYVLNLKTLANNDMVSEKHIGYIIGMIPTYDNKIKSMTTDSDSEPKKLSEFLGEIGEKINVVINDINILCSWDNCYNGYTPTTTYLYSIRDEHNNEIIWKTSKCLDLEKSIDKTISGTIKELKTYKDNKQTVVTRCRIK